MKTMDKELKNWLSYPRWKTMHDKIVDLVLSKGNISEGSGPYGKNKNYYNFCVNSISYPRLKEGMDDPKFWGRSSLEKLVSEFGYEIFAGEEYLIEVRYNAWDTELMFVTVKLVGDNKGGYVFKVYHEVEYYVHCSMWGAIQALKLVR